MKVNLRSHDNQRSLKRRSCQTQESQTSEWVKRRIESNTGVGQTQECSFYS